MSEQAKAEGPGQGHGGLWFAISLAAALGGAAAAGVYASAWFGYIRGDCGVVRFYEQLFGVMVFGAWGGCAALGVIVAAIGRRSGSGAVVLGALIAVVAGVGMVLVAGRTVRHIKEMDFPGKSREELLEIVNRPDASHRDMAAIELGRRKVLEAAPVLCDLLEDTQTGESLRHCAAVALGSMYAHPRPPELDVNRAVSALLDTLKAKEPPCIPAAAAYSLGQIGDRRAVGPLADLLSDPSRPGYTQASAARALGALGGEEAQSALEKARASGGQGEVADAIGQALADIRKGDAERAKGGVKK